MLKKTLLVGFACSTLLGVQAQKKDQLNTPDRPKLVVGLVVDQMRWDYLYRFYDKYQDNGFKRLLNQGYSLNNVDIDYVPAVTALGHTSIFTGSVPAIHGIAGNDWTDKETGEEIYCTTDNSVKPVGTDDKENGSHSPHQLWSTTITDELKLATNFQGKVVGVSLKDRASILPAGHTPDGAYWYDDSTGNFITSTYYMEELPNWVEKFNKAKWPKKLVSEGWNTLLPIAKYTESTKDNVNWEGKLGSAFTPTFPYNNLEKDFAKSKKIIRYTPFGNTLTLDFSKVAIASEDLGKDDITDFITINLASTDYVGHKFGPNSIEVEDTYIRLDRELASFFQYLDQKVGEGNYTLFLTADHGGAHANGFLKEHKIPTGFYGTKVDKEISKQLKDKFSVDNLVLNVQNYQIYLNHKVIEDNKLDEEDVKEFLVKTINKNKELLFAVDLEEIAESPVPDVLKTKIINGYNWKRSGDIQLITQDAYLPEYAQKGTTHSVWNSYDSHIPLIFMGKGISHGESNAAYNMTDIAPTVAALLKIQFPSGNIGEPITEVIGR